MRMIGLRTKYGKSQRVYNSIYPYVDSTLMDKVIKCPLCTSINNSKKFNDYPGSFLNCYELIQCLECALIFAYPLPLNKELNEYYASGLYYDKVSNPFSAGFIEFSLELAKSRLRLISDHVNFISGMRMIDIGAGNAQFSTALNELNDQFIYDAVEPDSNVSDQYGDLVSNHYYKISQVNKNTYDLAVLNQVLEHVSDPVEFLSSVSELIRERGYVYIDVPYQDYLFKPSVDPHILFWNQTCLKLLAAKTGFKVYFCDTAGMPHTAAKRFFYGPKNFRQKISNPWLYQRKINRLFGKMRLPKPFNTFRQFQSDHYSGDRQWLRCIAQKI